MNTEKQYYIVSIKHTSKGDTALTFWGSNRRGYTWDKSGAGLYSKDELRELVNEDNIAVEKSEVDEYWKEANDFGDKFYSIPNVRRVHEELGLSTKLMKPSKYATCRMKFVINS